MTVVVDSTRTADTLEVIALPTSPERVQISSVGGQTVSSGTPRGDSIAMLRVLVDSIGALDDRFQRERAALNEEAVQLTSVGRHSEDYARRYDAHRARSLHAERVRATRDRLRERARVLRERLGDAAPPDDSTRRARLANEMRAAYEGASDGDRTSRVATIRQGTATLRLRSGTWWIGVATHGAPPDRFTRFDVEAGARDTVNLATPSRRK